MAFFYCSAKGSPGTPPEEVIRSILAQLALSPDGLSVDKRITPDFTDSSKLEPSLENWLNLLGRVVADHKRVTVIIDALDECLNPDSLLLNLKELTDSAPGVLRFFFSSRPNVRLIQGLPPCHKLEVDQNTSLTEEDMETYIRSQVEEREKLRLGSRLLSRSSLSLERRFAFEARLIDALKRRAQGMLVLPTRYKVES
jgi:hypothetical protein